jgi:hypothetical protein
VSPVVRAGQAGVVSARSFKSERVPEIREEVVAPARTN